MKTSNSRKKRITITKGVHEPFKYKLAVTAKDHQKSLELLFSLQRLAYPELKPGIRIKKNVVRLIRPINTSKRKT